MKLQVGDIFINDGNVGLLVCIREEHTFPYYIDWSSGTKRHYTKSEISYWIEEEKIIYYPVVK
jgi:hypothetical protein